MSLLPDQHLSGLFVRSALDATASCLVEWGNRPEVGRLTSAGRRKASLSQAWSYVANRAFRPNRAFLISTAGGWTAFFNNHRDEYLPQAESYVLCERLKTETCFFSFDSRPDSPNRGSGQFSMNRFISGAVQTRDVLLYRESSWAFQQSGEPLPFERLDKYACRPKRDRLDEDTLRQYGESLGIPFCDPKIYGDDVVFLSWTTDSTMDPLTALSILENLFLS